jgi:hypothetical protein
MGENRGKDFETVIRKSFEAVFNCSVDRLHDQVNGFAGSSNICDFIVYKHPHQYYIECKSCYGNTLNFHNITDHQWEGLLKKTMIEGVIAGVMIWFIDHGKTIFVPIQDLESKKLQGLKSVNVNELGLWNYRNVPGTKRRIFFDYDMETFLDWTVNTNEQLR